MTWWPEFEDVVPASAWRDAVGRWVREQLRARRWKKLAQRLRRRLRERERALGRPV